MQAHRVLGEVVMRTTAHQPHRNSELSGTLFFSSSPLRVSESCNPLNPSPTSQHNPSLQHCNSCREKSPTFFGVLSSSCIHPHTKKKMRARSRVLASEVPFNTVRCGAGSSITNRSLTTQNSIAELNAAGDRPPRQRRPEARLRLVLGWQSCRIRTTRWWCQSAHSPR